MPGILNFVGFCLQPVRRSLSQTPWIKTSSWRDWSLTRHETWWNVCMRGRSSKGATSSDRENRAITFLCSKVNIAYWYNTQVQETGKGFRRFYRRSQWGCLCSEMICPCGGQCKFYLWPLWNRVRAIRSTLETWVLIWCFLMTFFISESPEASNSFLL